MGNGNIVCQFTLNNTCYLAVENCERHCRYHKRGSHYDLEHTVPAGFCQEAFHAIYPESLGLLYNGKFAGLDSLIVNCPKPDGGLTFEVRRIKKRSMIRRSEQVLRKLLSNLYPLEILDYDLKITPIAINGDCPKKMKIGIEYYFNLYSDKELCPAAFDSLFPFLFPLILSRDSMETNRIGSVVCPDHKASIVFRLHGKDNKSCVCEKEKQAVFPGCLPFRDIQIRTTGKENRQNIYFLKECLPPKLCYALFHNAYPYYYTLSHCGFFGWMKDRSAIIAQCPDPEKRIVVEIRRTSAGKIQLSILGQKQPCPKGINVGDAFLLEEEKYGLSFRLLRDIFPYANVVNLGISNMVRCGCTVGDRENDTVDVEIFNYTYS